MAGGGGGVEVRTPREMDRKLEVPSEAEILRMEIASLVNLLMEKQSDILPFDPEIARKITSLRSEIACQKLDRLNCLFSYILQRTDALCDEMA